MASQRVTITASAYTNLGAGPLSVVPLTKQPLHVAISASEPVNDTNSIPLAGRQMDYGGSGFVWAKAVAAESIPLIVVT